MAKSKISLEDKEKAIKIIDSFNKLTFIKNEKVEYYAVFKGDFLYLNRIEGDKDGPIARLKYTGKFSDWNFEIYRWSSGTYDPDACFFSGEDYIDGTIEGALKAVQKAYPPNWAPSDAQFANFMRQMFGK